jgi:phage FluMu protein Com
MSSPPRAPKLSSLPADTCWRCGRKLVIDVDADGYLVVDCPPCREEINRLRRRLARYEPEAAR